MCSRMYSITASCLASELKRSPIGRDVTDEVTAWVTSSTLDGPLRAAGNYEVMDQHTLAPTHTHAHLIYLQLQLVPGPSRRALHQPEPQQPEKTSHHHKSDKRAAARARTRILQCLIRKENYGKGRKVSRNLWTRPNEEWSPTAGGNNHINTSYIKQTRGYTGKPTYVNAVTPHWWRSPVNSM